MNQIKDRLLAPLFLTVSAAAMLGWLYLISWGVRHFLF